MRNLTYAELVEAEFALRQYIESAQEFPGDDSDEDRKGRAAAKRAHRKISADLIDAERRKGSRP